MTKSQKELLETKLWMLDLIHQTNDPERIKAIHNYLLQLNKQLEKKKEK